MLDVIVGVTTVAVELPRVTERVSVPSTTASCVVAIVKLNSAAPVARSAALVFVAVTVITPFARVLMFDNVFPDAAFSPPDSSAEKSARADDVHDARPSLNVTLCRAAGRPPLGVPV